MLIERYWIENKNKCYLFIKVDKAQLQDPETLFLGFNITFEYEY